MLDRIIRLTMFPIVLVSSLLDQNGVSEIFPDCLFQHFLKIECWGCGMTRAVLELCKFNLHKAIALNPAAPFVLVLICLIFCNEVFNKGKING
jgi:hypothetical protein